MKLMKMVWHQFGSALDDSHLFEVLLPVILILGPNVCSELFEFFTFDTVLLKVVKHLVLLD
jgi:hypothetical protein